MARQQNCEVCRVHGNSKIPLLTLCTRSPRSQVASALMQSTWFFRASLGTFLFAIDVWLITQLTASSGAAHLGVPCFVAFIALVLLNAVIGLKITLDQQHVLFNRQRVKERLAWDVSWSVVFM